MDGHLDLLGLDAVRAGDATPDQRAHAGACAECRDAVDGFRAIAGRLASPPIEIPAVVRRDILALARPRRLWRPVAAAALLLIGLGLWFATKPAAPHRLDIVDAYVVAARLRNGQTVDARYDLTGDGRVDARDVEEIARRSVAIR